MIRRSLVVVGLIAALVATAAPAGAQQYPPANNFIAVSDTTLFRGQTFTITTGTYVPGSTVTFTFFSDPTSLGSAVANAVGVAAIQATVPADAPLGTHTIQASGTASTGGPLVQTATITVEPSAQAAAGAAVSGALPRTGSSGTIPLTRVAAVLIAAGGALVFATRRRRQRETADVS